MSPHYTVESHPIHPIQSMAYRTERVYNCMHTQRHTLQQSVHYTGECIPHVYTLELGANALHIYEISGLSTSQSQKVNMTAD